jgi:hypothetical protein
MYSVQLFAIRREQGRLEEMVAATQAFVAQFPAVPAWRAGLAYQYAELGRTEEARREFEVVAATSGITRQARRASNRIWPARWAGHVQE